MVSHALDFVFKESLNRRQQKFCARCRRHFKDGDMVHSRNGFRHRRVYHLACWEGLFFE